ncbi:hypothetical protein ACHAQA_003148 [Verticillium albo-atrum]
MGSNGGVGAGRTSAPLPHIEDLTSRPVDIDMKLPLRKILEKTDAVLRSAEAFRDFGRPAEALREFIQAATVTVRLVPTHPEYVSIQVGRPELKRMYNNLLSKINEQHPAFEKIKAAIIEDNVKTGVKRQSQQPLSPNNRPEKAGLGSMATENNAKPKPAIQPKPLSLQGRPTSMNANDPLHQRFLGLGGPQSSLGQDPRIKTHPHVTSTVAPSFSKPTIDHTNLPKEPKAIYSPATGKTLPEAAGALPSSTKTMYTPNPSSVPAKPSNPSTTDYFGPVRTAPAKVVAPRPSTTGPQADPAKAPKVTIPEGDSINAEELYRLQKSARILLIDVRPREEFDDGHIPSQSIMCVEPSILVRDDVTGAAIEDTLILAPEQDSALFLARATFDLVVFYDQDSTSLPKYVTKKEDGVLLTLKRALEILSVGKELPHKPKLLVGGLEAWTDSFGAQCLSATSATSGVPPILQKKPVKPAQKAAVRYPGLKNIPQRKIDEWSLRIGNEDQTIRIIRSPEELMRDFSSPSQQSMVSPRPAPPGRAPPGVPPRPPKGNDMFGALPSQPTMPRPAVAKPTLSGLTDNTSSAAQSTQSLVSARPKGGAQHMTGLNNPNNWCYANSLIQSLRLSPGFGRELASKDWDKLYAIPRKRDEKSDHPRLMARIIANLFHWMAEGSFPVMKAQTLMDYSLSLCSGANSIQQFGSNRQQDASEFMIWLIDALHQETNTKRDKEYVDSTNKPDMSNGNSLVQGAAEWWANYSVANQSIVDRYWRGVQAQLVTCTACNNRTWSWTPFDSIMLHIDNDKLHTLEDCLSLNSKEEVLDGYKCDGCHNMTRAVKSVYYPRLPELLCISLSRFSTGEGKVPRDITWNLNKLNMEPYIAGAADRQSLARAGVHAASDYEYECYAVIIHAGRNLSSGHYFTYARDSTTADSSTWYQLNDSHITKIGSNPSEIFGNSNDTPYLAFFRRKQPGSSGVKGSNL